SACLLPMDSGACTDSQTKYYYNEVKDQCEVFSYSGCGGNANKFDTLAECEAMC
ncbi:hypothetical protein LOTGIDRAFT_80595, partial [Lottia gigantea]